MPLFHLSLLSLMAKARSLSYIRTPEMHRVGSGLICKHFTWLDRISRDKYSSFLLTFVNYCLKFFIILAPIGCVGLEYVLQLLFGEEMQNC